MFALAVIDNRIFATSNFSDWKEVFHPFGFGEITSDTIHQADIDASKEGKYLKRFIMVDKDGELVLILEESEQKAIDRFLADEREFDGEDRADNEILAGCTITEVKFLFDNPINVMTTLLG